MKKILYSRIFQFSSALFFVGAIFIIALSLFSSSANSAATSRDAIAIRVLPNVNHYSPLRWYKEQGFSGSPQSMLVDGYEAVRDGRTVYVNVANVVDTDEDGVTDKLYTNIYLISYNQAAENSTIDIFGKILAHWKFNTNVTTAGNCSLETEKACLSDDDCASDEHCDSAKAKIIRDTKRLADLAELQIAIENYFSQYDYYPKLTSGTYLANKSISTWPSWNATLGAELGLAMPVDPINELGDCGGENIDKNGNQYTGTNATCSMDGSDYTGSCNSAYWDYSFSVSKDGNYQAFIESTNNSSSPYGDLDVFTLTQESVCPASGVQHKVEIYMDDALKGYVCNDAVDSTATHQIGDVDLGFITAGTHTIKYKWVNDWTYNPDGVWGTGDEADSNVRIYKVGLAEISDYDATTCWDAVNKKFAGVVDGNNLTLPAGSNAYVYSAAADGSSYSLDMGTEAGSLNADGSYSYNGGAGSANNAGAKTNQAPTFTDVSLPKCYSLNEYSNGFIEAKDPDDDQAVLKWMITGASYISNFDAVTKTWVVSDENIWRTQLNDFLTSGTPALQWVDPKILVSTGVLTQKSISAGKAGRAGTYTFKVEVSDDKDISTKDFVLVVNSRCGDGGVQAPNSYGFNEQCDDGNDNDDDICHNDCMWTIKTQTISSFAPLSMDGQGSSGDGVFYDNNNSSSVVTNQVDASAYNYLKLSGTQKTPYAWFAVMYENNLVKMRTYDGFKRDCVRSGATIDCFWDTSSTESQGALLGTFSTGGQRPSRTSVNAETGDIWVHNRYEQNVSKLDINGTLIKTCNIDPNFSPVANYSTDNYNGGTALSSVWYSGGGLAIAENGDVWAGNYYTGVISRIPGGDDDGCTPIQQINVGGNTYGLAIDSMGNLWANMSNGLVTKIDTSDMTISTYPLPHSIYGITVDANDNVWTGYYDGVSSNGYGGVQKLPKNSPVNTTLTDYSIGNDVTGVSIDSLGGIWGSGYNDLNIVGVDNNGAIKTLVGGSAQLSCGGEYIHGVGASSEGEVFGIGVNNAKVYFFNATTGSSLGEYCVFSDCRSATIYTYSDMAGLNRAMILRSGTWMSQIFDGLYNDQYWGKLTWDEVIPSEKQNIEIYIGIRNNMDNNIIFDTVDNWNAQASPSDDRKGRYVQIKILMRSNQAGVSPIISNIKFTN